MGAKRRALREATAASAMPQLQRGRDVEVEEVDQAYRDRAKAGGHSLPDGSYPILDTKRLHSAAVLAASKHGDWRAAKVLIRKEARRLGVDVTTLPGFGPKVSKKNGKRARESLNICVRELKRSGGGVYECTIIREGPGNAVDANYYTRQALQGAVARKLFEGLQCYANHPTPEEERSRPERDVRQLVGHFREARFVDGRAAEVRAKFLPIDGKATNGSAASSSRPWTGCRAGR
jgi:hypothetical protein